MNIGYLGPKGTFSYEACNKYYNNNIVKLEYKTILDTIIALENNEIEEAVVPIENSLQGCVTEAIDTLVQNRDIKVKDEILLGIKQNLMCNKNCKIDEIQKVYSHPQALAQCRNYLSRLLPNAKIIQEESTAIAGKIVSETKDIPVACIGNILLIDEYKLNLIEADIEDNRFNETRFWVLSKKENTNMKHQKMSIIFSVKDKPGALYNVLHVFNEYNLNLTKIESRPAKTVLGEYIFWIDVTISDNSAEERAIKAIQDKGIFIRILGKY